MYRRNYKRRRRNRYKRRVRRTIKRPMTTGKVKRIIDAELKVRDLGVGPLEIPSITGQVVHISLIGQGDENTQRNGNWIKPTSWMGTITVQGNNAGAGDGIVPQYRVGIVCWKENEGINPFTLGSVMQDTAAPHQQFNIENKGQFKILWSRTGILSQDDDNPQFLKIHRFYVKPPMKILYDGDAFKNNHLFIFAYSDIDTAASPPSFSFDTRLRYTDS